MKRNRKAADSPQSIKDRFSFLIEIGEGKIEREREKVGKTSIMKTNHSELGTELDHRNR